MLHKPGTPEDWSRPLNRLDPWGLAGAPSEKIFTSMNGSAQGTR